MSRKKTIINSFLLAFMFSFFTILILFPQVGEVFYTDISNGSIEVSPSFLIKVVVILI